VLPYDNGRSYGDSCLNLSGTLLQTRSFDRFNCFNRQTGVLPCKAGVLLAVDPRGRGRRGLARSGHAGDPLGHGGRRHCVGMLVKDDATATGGRRLRRPETAVSGATPCSRPLWLYAAAALHDSRHCPGGRRP
jgi:hypothetical protein